MELRSYFLPWPTAAFTAGIGLLGVGIVNESWKLQVAGGALASMGAVIWLILVLSGARSASNGSRAAPRAGISSPAFRIGKLGEGEFTDNEHRGTLLESDEVGRLKAKRNRQTN